MRNRWRRQRLPEEMRAEVAPKNILMIGPTGVGKTEIARRLALLSGAPFVKVEATRYTEVGYHGRDVESMVRDLVKQSINMFQTRAREEVRARAVQAAEDRLLDLLLPAPSAWSQKTDTAGESVSTSEPSAGELHEKTREKLRKKLRDGELDKREIEIDIQAPVEGVAGIFAPGMGEEAGA